MDKSKYFTNDEQVRDSLKTIDILGLIDEFYDAKNKAECALKKACEKI